MSEQRWPRRAGMFWDDIFNLIDGETWVGTDETGRTYQYVAGIGEAADKLWAKLAPYESVPASLRERLRAALRTAGFVDPDDGTVPMWPHGDRFPYGPVWVSADRLVDAVLANLPELDVEE